MSLRISAIVPVLNEASRIAALLEALRRQSLHEIIVVDGGSSDGTAAIASASGAARVLQSAAGRGLQMNAGAASASGEILWFVHADTRPPPHAAELIQQALREEGVIGGAFRIWTIPDAPQRTWLAPLLHLADLRSRYSSLPYGDQAMFIRADVFRAAGGFPDMPLMEDLELSRRLRRFGRLLTLRASVLVSGRRFQARPLYYTFLINVFPLLYRAGVSPARLNAWYEDVR